ncbi:MULTISPECIES: type II toxin-antitoxin system CcdA family antitoxin [unclassified Nitrospirillum]|uniref:type II toxin-antitoxin system CcdA family antitoxin n=1 Tax=unclassified Nitrospirillum TaxID=2627523 RepID=UPI002ACA3FDC|nr:MULTISPECIES: type II toxin-antitoxin system CcdA family antitoxin [unclassified Nitrospirillum]MDZ5649570.1 type II toxin-antitoxin system CcdA family antitoxin [Nitrospirillum sp. BR 11828]MEA1652716.1 type II toxin-antitoxin system CcdA family antitoxin [Nitrospirillum sp. BR 11164]
MRPQMVPPASTESGPRKGTNVSLPEALVAEAKVLGINISRACERGLATEIAEKKAAQWLERNQGAIDDWNAYVEKNGVPLSEFRQF